VCPVRQRRRRRARAGHATYLRDVRAAEAVACEPLKPVLRERAGRRVDARARDVDVDLDGALPRHEEARPAAREATVRGAVGRRPRRPALHADVDHRNLRGERIDVLSEDAFVGELDEALHHRSGHGVPCAV
jgi:hypothetical protein